MSIDGHQFLMMLGPAGGGCRVSQLLRVVSAQQGCCAGGGCATSRWLIFRQRPVLDLRVVLVDRRLGRLWLSFVLLCFCLPWRCQALVALSV